MRVRPDLLTLISFLTKHFREPDEDDWGKLKRDLKYLKGTLHLKLVLVIVYMETIHWCFDASYGTHYDCKGHTGMMMAMGFGALMSISKGHKINVRSSTKAKLVGIDNALGDILWGKYFLEYQGFKIKHNVVHQYNTSTILLTTNGTWYKNTKHIEHNFFLVKDKIEIGIMEIKWTPTEMM